MTVNKPNGSAGSFLDPKTTAQNPKKKQGSISFGPTKKTVTVQKTTDKDSAFTTHRLKRPFSSEGLEHPVPKRRKVSATGKNSKIAMSTIEPATGTKGQDIPQPQEKKSLFKRLFSAFIDEETHVSTNSKRHQASVKRRRPNDNVYEDMKASMVFEKREKSSKRPYAIMSETSGHAPIKRRRYNVDMKASTVFEERKKSLKRSYNVISETNGHAPIKRRQIISNSLVKQPSKHALDHTISTKSNKYFKQPYAIVSTSGPNASCKKRQVNHSNKNNIRRDSPKVATTKRIATTVHNRVLKENGGQLKKKLYSSQIESDQPKKRQRIENEVVMTGALLHTPAARTAYDILMPQSSNVNIVTYINEIKKIFINKYELKRFIKSDQVSRIITQCTTRNLQTQKREKSDLIDPNVSHLVSLHTEFKSIDSVDILNDILKSETLTAILPPLFTTSIRTSFPRKKSIQGWDVVLPAYQYIQQHGNALRQQALADPLGFAKEKKGAILPFSIIAFKTSSTGEVSFFVTGKIIGRGGFKIVRKLIAFETQSAHFVKASAKKTTDKKIAREDFAKEAQISKELIKEQVPFILKIWQVSTEKSIRIISELCNKGTLESVAKKLNKIELYRISAQVCDAIAGMHKKEIAHLDLKLGNIFLKEDENNALSIRVGDFGAATVFTSRDSTKSTELVSTFAAPEMVQSHTDQRKIPVTAALDIWSLGILLYELKYGSIDSKKYYLIHSYAVHNYPEFTRTVEDLVRYLNIGSNKFDRLIIKMLSINPTQRPSSEEVQKTIQELYSEERNKKVTVEENMPMHINATNTLNTLLPNHSSSEPNTSAILVNPADDTIPFKGEDKEVPITKENGSSFLDESTPKKRSFVEKAVRFVRSFYSNKTNNEKDNLAAVLQKPTKDAPFVSETSRVQSSSTFAKKAKESIRSFFSSKKMSRTITDPNINATEYSGGDNQQSSLQHQEMSLQNTSDQQLPKNSPQENPADIASSNSSNSSTHSRRRITQNFSLWIQKAITSVTTFSFQKK